MNKPRASSNAGIYALSNIPTIVTKVAITTIKAGILILSGINFLIRDITIFEQIKTAVVESPIPNPFIADVVTPRVGHIPITCTSTGFSSTIPFFNNFVNFIFYPSILLNRLTAALTALTIDFDDIVAPDTTCISFSFLRASDTSSTS